MGAEYRKNHKGYETKQSGQKKDFLVFVLSYVSLTLGFNRFSVVQKFHITNYSLINETTNH